MTSQTDHSLWPSEIQIVESNSWYLPNHGWRGAHIAGKVSSAMGINWSWKWVFRTRWSVSHPERFQKPVNYQSIEFALHLVHFFTLPSLAAAFYSPTPEVSGLPLPIIYSICMQSRDAIHSCINLYLWPTYTHSGLQAGGQENLSSYWSFRWRVSDYSDSPGWSNSRIKALTHQPARLHAQILFHPGVYR